MNYNFQRIAIIGAGTMGAGIAGHIANAGRQVLLLDLPQKQAANATAEAGIKRLLESDPPALMHNSRVNLIEVGNTHDDFAKLAECDWVIEAVIENLSVKQMLYKRLNQVINPKCVVTSNTSSIPISLLVANMPLTFRRRFAITHYFNPVRYMRLLELVSGLDTDTAVMDALAQYNDQVLGKGVVRCNDTPGFLGNRVGVFALQVGMDEAFKAQLPIEWADALFGRPMGIPKTGIFALYDLIGLDLMVDVVSALDNILPKNDAFHAVGWNNNPMFAHFKAMIDNGFTGNKGKGGFYRQNNKSVLALDLITGAMRLRRNDIPKKAQMAAHTQNLDKSLQTLISNNPKQDFDMKRQTNFTRRVLARILAYAANLLPTVCHSPQDIDDAMKLGFNWIRGPFEIIDALGVDKVATMIDEVGLRLPDALKKSQAFGNFYSVKDKTLNVRVFDNEKYDYICAPVSFSEGTIRLNMHRRTFKPIISNRTASLFALPNDLRLVEFHSKANVLDTDSIQIITAATDNHGKGIVIHNDAQHFCAGVDLNQFRSFIKARDWHGMNNFLNDFQQAVKALRYVTVPVIGAPSGLTIGGGFEVLAHCDKLVVHTNSVLGLVETRVGLIPSGGGVKETLRRWFLVVNDWHKAVWQTWIQISFAHTGSSPELANKYRYFMQNRDISIMNRDKLLSSACRELTAMAADYSPERSPRFVLPGRKILQKMTDFMNIGITRGQFYPHDKTVAMELASIVVNIDSDDDLIQNEQQMFDRERAAFLRLAKTRKTFERISSLLDNGSPIRN